MTKSRVRRLESPDEKHARRLVEHGLSVERGTPVVLEFWDDNSEDGRHDYWVDPVKRWGALEVTTLADQGTITDLMHWQRRGPGDTRQFGGLAKAWQLMIDPSVNARAVMENVAQWLASLEADDIKSTSRWDTKRLYVHPHPTVWAMVDAGICSVGVLTTLPPGTVLFHYVWSVPSRPDGDPNHVVAVVDQAMSLERHRKDAEKLARSGAAERHLFFRVSSSRLDVMRAFQAGIPTMAPTAGPAITAVWVAVGAEALYWSIAAGWRRFMATA